MTLVYTGAPTPPRRRVFLPLCIFLEADLPAKRASAEAPPRLPCADVDPCGSRDPQAPASQGPEAPLGVSRCSADTGSAAPAISTPSTGRAGRSRRAFSCSTGSHVTTVGTSRGSDWPCRRRAARRSSATGSSANCARPGAPRSPRSQPGRDYVLIVRPGLAEASEQRGFDWLTERIGEVLQKAAA